MADITAQIDKSAESRLVFDAFRNDSLTKGMCKIYCGSDNMALAVTGEHPRNETAVQL